MSLHYSFRWSSIVPVRALATLATVALFAATIAAYAQASVVAIDREPAVTQNSDEDGITPLMCAARDGERKALRSLLNAGTEVDARDVYGWSALTYAARRGDASMITALANKGADLNNQSDEGLTPLMYASTEGYADAVRVLVERGANVNATSKGGATALGLAEARGHAQRETAGQVSGGAAFSATEQRDYRAVIEYLKQAGGVVGKPGPVLQISPVVDSRPVALNRPYPSYTEEARRHKINARIDIRVLVGEDGSVKKVRVLIGAPDGLTKQAVMAANQLKFKPASSGGRAVEFWTPLSMDFNVR